MMKRTSEGICVGKHKKEKKKAKGRKPTKDHISFSATCRVPCFPCFEQHPSRVVQATYKARQGSLCGCRWEVNTDETHKDKYTHTYEEGRCHLLRRLHQPIHSASETAALPSHPHLPPPSGRQAAHSERAASQSIHTLWITSKQHTTRHGFATSRPQPPRGKDDDFAVYGLQFTYDQRQTKTHRTAKPNNPPSLPLDAARERQASRGKASRAHVRGRWVPVWAPV